MVTTTDTTSSSIVLDDAVDARRCDWHESATVLLIVRGDDPDAIVGEDAIGEDRCRSLVGKLGIR
jgi:hypothetical protein